MPEGLQKTNLFMTYTEALKYATFSHHEKSVIS